jgi:hypothetical protein
LENNEVIRGIDRGGNCEPAHIPRTGELYRFTSPPQLTNMYGEENDRNYKLSALDHDNTARRVEGKAAAIALCCVLDRNATFFAAQKRG